MNIRILFEDSESSPISKLLVSIFGDDVRFCTTCDRVANDALLLANDSSIDLVVCYFDCHPGNQDALYVYRNISRDVSVSDKIVVLKSQSIEYYILCMFVNLRLTKGRLISEFINMLNGDMLIYSDRSFEKYCKSMIGNIGMLCAINKVKIANRPLDRLWYRDGCCAGIKANVPKGCKQLSLLQKKLALIYYLPYCDVKYIPTEFRSMIEDKSVISAIKKCNEEFEYLQNHLQKRTNIVAKEVSDTT